MNTTPDTDTLDAVLERVDANFDASLDRLGEILRIPSVSTDPAHDGDVRAAADWFVSAFRDLGFEAESVATPGHPMVLASIPAPAGRPTILYYGHYDVQPEDPLDEWRSPPFEPTIVDREGIDGGRIVARGAVDDKGQVMTFVEAFRAWRDATGSLPVGVTVMLEGEEESGSPSLDGFLASNVERLAADVCVVSDTGMWNAETPAITTMLRGMVYVEVTISGPTHDLHSGMYGGAVANPANLLARIIAAMHDDDGRVTLPGFHDGVVDPPAEVLDRWRDRPSTSTASWAATPASGRRPSSPRRAGRRSVAVWFRVRIRPRSSRRSAPSSSRGFPRATPPGSSRTARTPRSWCPPTAPG